MHVRSRSKVRSRRLTEKESLTRIPIYSPHILGNMRESARSELSFIYRGKQQQQQRQIPRA